MKVLPSLDKHYSKTTENYIIFFQLYFNYRYEDGYWPLNIELDVSRKTSSLKNS